MKVAIYGRKIKPRHADYVGALFSYMDKQNVEVFLGENLRESVAVMNGDWNKAFKWFNNDEPLRDVDALITLGGDGTILDAVGLIGDSGIPVLGINLGRLGFLASVRKESYEQAIDALINGTYTLDKRSLIQITGEGDLFQDNPFALNEFTIQREKTSSMIQITAFLNGEPLNKFWSDGIIVATPTGSTGYSLSCGGPIIYPTSNNFVLTPVAPHNLGVRPMVVPDDAVLTFIVDGRSDTFSATADSRNESITSGYTVAIQRAPFHLNLVRLSDASFISALKEKLMWGSDLRN